MWIEHLQPLRDRLVADAARLLELESNWFPSLAEFRKAYDHLADRTRIERADDLGLPKPAEPMVPPDEIKALIEKARRNLTEGAARNPLRLPKRAITDTHRPVT